MKNSTQRGLITLKIMVAALFGSAFLWQCANIGAPQGGPRDTLPPKVMEGKPEFNTVNFDGKKIYIEFDEYIKLQDQQKEFFTSPPMKHLPVLTLRGKGVEIEITDTLDENTTYALNFGSTIRDNNESNPLNGFRYVFSTGNYIDSMFMSGYAVNAYKKDSVSKTLIYFFDPAVDSIPQYDSVLFKARPLAVARAENNGIFIAQNLKPIDYRVYAFADENGNFTYEPGTEMVGFLEETFNPIDLPNFDIWYDTTRSYLSADPQIYFRMFADKQFLRQNLATKNRPLQRKIELYFSAPYPTIDSLFLDGIDSTQVITEYLTADRDSINLWLTAPVENMPDTIKGRITYHKHDSINQLVPTSENLAFFWKYIETKEEERERERLEKERERALEDSTEFEEPVVPNPFKYKLTPGSELNPEENLTLEFDYPLTAMDSTQVSLIRIAEEEKMYAVNYTLSQDTLNIRKWAIAAQWQIDQKYRLEIPAGAIQNVAGEQNDTIRSEFTVMNPEKYGMLSLNITGKTPESKYILQLLDDGDRILQEKTLASTGSHEFLYINPGEVKVRIVEDMNGNGKWDSGDMINRLQPERVEIFMPPSGNELTEMKANNKVEFSIDMADMFKPIDIMDIRRQISKAEELRYIKWREEKEKKRLEELEREQGQQGMGMGNSGGMGGMGSGGFGGMGSGGMNY
jgi:uncharacterized protein (DUF2141 family)